MSEEMDQTDPPSDPATPPTPPMPPPAPPQVVHNVTQPVASNGMAVAALVLGIVGLVLFLTVWGGVILGVLAIVFGVLGRSKATLGAPNKGLATAGLVLGIVALVSSVLLLVLILSVANEAGGIFEEVRDLVELCLEDPSDPSC